MFDIMTAYENNIPIIMCDDYDPHSGVKPAIDKLKNHIDIEEVEFRTPYNDTKKSKK